MDLVDEENRVLLLREPIEHLLHTLLEISAVACARDERTEVECEHARAFQHVGNLTLVDAQRQAFGQRRLTHAGFANEQRVVLATPAEHLDHPLDLEGPPDERIDLAGSGPRHEIRGVRLQRVRRRALLSTCRAGRGGLGLRAVRQHAQQQQPLDTLRTQEVRGVTVLFLKKEDQQASALHVLGARRHSVHHRLLNHAVESERWLWFNDRRRRHGRERAGEHISQLPTQHFDVGATRRQHVPSLRLVGDRQKQVLEPHFLVPTIGRNAKGSLNRLERLRRKRHRCFTHVRVRPRAPW